VPYHWKPETITSISEIVERGEFSTHIISTNNIAQVDSRSYYVSQCAEYECPGGEYISLLLFDYIKQDYQCVPISDECEASSCIFQNLLPRTILLSCTR
jgi:hypothetical protein